MNNENIKKIGLWNIVGLGVGGAVGSGIFVTLGSAIEKTGRSILPITIICVFYMLLAYWYNLGMSGIFVINGGDYSMKGRPCSPDTAGGQMLSGRSVLPAIRLRLPAILAICSRSSMNTVR